MEKTKPYLFFVNSQCNCAKSIFTKKILTSIAIKTVVIKKISYICIDIIGEMFMKTQNSATTPSRRYALKRLKNKKGNVQPGHTNPNKTKNAPQIF